MARTDRMHAYLATATPKKPKQFSIKEINELLGRQFRRDMIAKGLLKDEAKKPKSFWTYPISLGKSGRVEAFTRSEARSLIKKELGVSRLPPGFKIEKVGDAD